MPRRPWVARTTAGMHPTTRQYPLATGEVPEAGDIVHFNGSKEIVRTTAADPTPLLGIAEEPHDHDIIQGYLLVTVFTTDVILAIEGSRAPLATDVNVAYGIARDADGVWTLDLTDTVATRFTVVDIDISRNLYFVKALAAHRQSPE